MNKDLIIAKQKELIDGYEKILKNMFDYIPNLETKWCSIKQQIKNAESEQEEPEQSSSEEQPVKSAEEIKQQLAEANKDSSWKGHSQGYYYHFIEGWEAHSQFTTQRQEITDEEIEKEAHEFCITSGNRSLSPLVETGIVIGMKLMRNKQGKGIDLREELIKFLEWFNENSFKYSIHTEDEVIVDEYLSKIKPQ